MTFGNGIIETSKHSYDSDMEPVLGFVLSRMSPSPSKLLPLSSGAWPRPLARQCDILLTIKLFLSLGISLVQLWVIYITSFISRHNVLLYDKLRIEIDNWTMNLPILRYYGHAAHQRRCSGLAGWVGTWQAREGGSAMLPLPSRKFRYFYEGCLSDLWDVFLPKKPSVGHLNTLNSLQ